MVNEINENELKQWFETITDPRQQAIHTNIEILKLETYVKDRNFAKQEQEEQLKQIELDTKSKVREEASNAEPGDKTLSSEAKIDTEIKKRLRENTEYTKIQESIDTIKQDIEATDINISFYKRTFQILISFANQWVKV